jgi:hypothetical protein
MSLTRKALNNFNSIVNKKPREKERKKKKKKKFHCHILPSRNRSARSGQVCVSWRVLGRKGGKKTPRAVSSLTEREKERKGVRSITFLIDSRGSLGS